MEDCIGKFIGLSKIKEIKKLKRKTYLGKDAWELAFDDKTKKEFPAEMVRKIMTEDTKDFTALREITVNPVVEKILEILLDSEIPIEYIEFVLTKTSVSLGESLKQAEDILWKKKMEERTMRDVDVILKNADPKVEKD